MKRTIFRYIVPFYGLIFLSKQIEAKPYVATDSTIVNNTNDAKNFNDSSAKDSTLTAFLIRKAKESKNSEFPKVKILGLLVNRYSYSMTNHSDPNGNYVSSGGNNNSFSMKHAFVTVAAQITKKIDATVMVDLADMQKPVASRKVLDFAFIHYDLNPSLNFIVGEFRPFTGVENRIAPQFIRTLDYTNGYYLNASMGWEGFQPGAAVYGEVPGMGKNLSYYLGFSNGNGTNNYDNNNNKDAYFRAQTDFSKNISIGAYAGVGKGPAIMKKNGYLIGADLNSQLDISPCCNLALQAAWKEGTNSAQYAADYGTTNLHATSDYQFSDFYIYPQMRYALHQPSCCIKSLDFTMRYEYLNRSTKFNSNPESSFTPLVGLSFLNNYAATISVGMSINHFKHQDFADNYFNNNQGVVQFQVAL